jgi:hypothetical protein
MKLVLWVIWLPILALFVTWGLYDLVVTARTGPRRVTITRQIQCASHRWPAVPFSVGLALGILLGHLFYCF